MNRTSRASRLVRSAARSPVLAITGPEVVRKLTPSSRATICARVVLPRPGGPTNSTWSSASLRARAAAMKTLRLDRAWLWPTNSARCCGRSEPSVTSSSRRSGETRRRGGVLIARSSQRHLQLDLVAHGDAVRPHDGHVGKQRTDRVDRAGIDRDDTEPAALIKAERVEIVVGDDDAQQSRALVAAEPHHGIKQRRADAALLADVVEGGEIDHRPFEQPCRHAGEPSLMIGGERLDVLGMHDLAAQHQRAVAPAQAQEFLEKGAIGERSDLERDTLISHLLNSLKPSRMSRPPSAPSPASRAAAAMAAAACG